MQSTELIGVAVLCLFLQSATAQSCTTEPDISCTDNVANTFLSIHDSVSKSALTTPGALDVVFVLDEGALLTHNHYWTKQFLRILSEVLVFSPDYAWVSLITYSSTAKVVLPLSASSDVCSLTANIENMTLRAGSSYLDNGLKEAITQLNSGRPTATKLTILVTNGDWGNLGGLPEASVNTLKGLGYLSAIILKHPEKTVGLLRDVIFDYMVSFFGSKKLGFTVEMTPEYLRDLHSIVTLNKAMGTDWPLDLEVAKTKCDALKRSCAATQVCVCEARTVAREYICRGKDEDPPEKVKCDGPSSPIALGASNNSVLVSWAKPVFSDNSGVVSTVTDRLPGLYQPGTYDVITTATDKNKNTASCKFSFVVTS